jgi:hypothetical protein
MRSHAPAVKAILCVGVLALAGLPSAATATPVVVSRAAAVPIPIEPRNPHSATYPGSGEYLGGPTAAFAEFKFSGTEYGGFTSPLTKVVALLPAGSKVDSHGFPTCEEATLKAKGPEGCPSGSFAGPLGEGEGVVSFGSSRVHEHFTLQALFAPGGGLEFFVYGPTPADFEFITPGGFAPVASGPYGLKFTADVPLVETVPGALDGSAIWFKITIGAALKKGNKLISYETLPKRCPKGGFPVESELTFLSGETVTVMNKVPCPRHRR